MTKETKQDVFEDALRALEEFGEQGSSWEMAYDYLSARYAAASDSDTDVRTQAGSKAMIAVMLVISGAAMWMWANWKRGK